MRERGLGDVGPKGRLVSTRGTPQKCGGGTPAAVQGRYPGGRNQRNSRTGLNYRAKPGETLINEHVAGI